MARVRVLINGAETGLKLLRLKLTDSISDYSAHAEMEFLNPKGANNDAVSINDTIEIDLNNGGAWYKRFEGYATRVDADPQQHRLKVQAISWNGRLQERHLNEAYDHEELSQIVRLASTNLLSEFGQDYIEQTGTETLLQKVDTSDGVLLVDTIGGAVAQRFTASELSNVFKVRVYFTAVNNGVADWEIREDDSGIPGGLLKIRSNIPLSSGWNEVILTREGLTNGSNYWLVIRLKSGDFTVATNGSGSSGRVKTYDGSSWTTATADDLQNEIYALENGTILEHYKAVEKPLDRVFKELAEMVGWVFYIDKDRKIHFHPESFETTGLTLDKFFEADEGIEGKKIYNVVKVYGGNDIREGSEQFKGDGVKKAFYLTLGRVVRDSVSVSGTTETYSMNYETNAVIFDNPISDGTTITVSYKYFVPIVAVASDDVSVAQIGQRELVKVDENIRTLTRANEVANALLSLYHDPKTYYRLKTRVYPTVEAGKIVHLQNSLLGLDGDYIVVKSEVEYGRQGYWMRLNAAAQEVMTLPEVLKELKEMIVETRIKQTEGTRKTTDLKNFFDQMFLDENLTKQYRLINDSFIIGHPINGVLGSAKLGDRRGSWTNT